MRKFRSRTHPKHPQKVAYPTCDDGPTEATKRMRPSTARLQIVRI